MTRVSNNNIKEIRLMTGLSQAKFAEKYGIPKRSIENWESGKRNCPPYVESLLKKVVETDIENKED